MSQQRAGLTAQLVALLANGPKHRDALAAELGLLAGEVTQKLYQRMAGVGDVHRVGAVWHPGPAPAGHVDPRGRRVVVRKMSAADLAEAAQAAQRTRDEAVRARAAREIVCEVATSRTYSAPGEYRPPRMVIRDGAFDYLATPTRVGDARLPYRGATNMSTTAMAAGARSGVK